MNPSEKIEEAIGDIYTENNQEKLANLLQALLEAGQEEAQLMVPVVAPGEDAAGEPMRVQTQDGAMWLAGFTSKGEYEKGEACPVVSCGYFAYMQKALEAEEVEGILLNPWGNGFLFTKDLIRMVCQVRDQGLS
jgi:hypothetical protein